MSTAKADDFELDELTVPPPRPMSEEEFDNWHDELLRGEWVDGRVEFMAPANTEHCEIQNLLLFALSAFVNFHQLGKVWGPEMAVKLPGMRRRRVPDIVFLSQSRLDLVEKTYINGAPDLVMEVVSPDSESRDWRKKYEEYERAGVKEYWIVDPGSEVMEAYHLADEGVYEQIAAQHDRVTSLIVPGFFVKLDWLWELPAPQLLEIQRELKIID